MYSVFSHINTSTGYVCPVSLLKQFKNRLLPLSNTNTGAICLFCLLSQIADEPMYGLFLLIFLKHHDSASWAVSSLLSKVLTKEAMSGSLLSINTHQDRSCPLLFCPKSPLGEVMFASSLWLSRFLWTCKWLAALRSQKQGRSPLCLRFLSGSQIILAKHNMEHLNSWRLCSTTVLYQ